MSPNTETTGAAASAGARVAVDNDDACIIDLVDENESRTRTRASSSSSSVVVKVEGSKTNAKGSGGTCRRKRAHSVLVKKEGEGNDDDDSNNCNKNKKRKSQTTNNKQDKNDEDDKDEEKNDAHDDEIEVVRLIAAAAKPPPQSTNDDQNKNDADDDDDDDVELVGLMNEQRLPHMRQHCTEKPFQADLGYSLAARKAVNQEYCDCCYCYVCDIKASQCKDWLNDHCLANDKGPQAHIWKMLREQVRRQNNRNKMLREQVRRQNNPNKTSSSTSTSSTSTTSAATSIADALERSLMGLLDGSHLTTAPPYEEGPLPPDRHETVQTKTASNNPQSWTQCRHCQWYSQLSGRRVSGGDAWKGDAWKGDHRDWCHACGRVACQKALKPPQAIDFQPPTATTAASQEEEETNNSNNNNNNTATNINNNKDEVFDLGTVEIPFRLHAHDPRDMKEFRNKWQDNEGKPGWIYNQADMQEEMFLHRLGPKPKISHLLLAIPIVTQDKIPTDGTVKVVSSSGLSSRDDTIRPLASETQALVVESSQHIALLSEMYDQPEPPKDKKNKHAQQSASKPMMINGNVNATFDRNTGQGMIQLRVFVRHASPTNHSCESPAALTRFLALWFQVTPLSLKDINWSLTAAENNKNNMDDDDKDEIRLYQARRRFDVPPFKLAIDEAKKVLESYDPSAAAEELNSTLSSKMETVQSLESGAEIDASSLSSTHSISVSTTTPRLGGFCTNETDFAGVVQRYLRESLVDFVEEGSGESMELYLGEIHGQTSLHRNMATNGNGNASRRGRWQAWRMYNAYFSLKDYRLSKMLYPNARDLYRAVRSLNNLMFHMENLGHEASPLIEGLSVDLLPFQKQTVQWAYERETVPGGIQSFWCPKLPPVPQQQQQQGVAMTDDENSDNQDLYYNFLLGKFSKEKPSLVRGGIIADQMGLGKTCSSLALILRNPAPAVPASGSHASDIVVPPDDGTTAAAFRDPDLYAKTATAKGKKKRGSIVSRGTLVICNVSLVGQWIDEAKSKLVDPGLVYSYHGAKRKRDPNVLAQNSIVVTTYETLTSDMTYHARKSKDPDFCPPCEQVRWWRIITDECHLLRSNSKRKDAVMNLVADNKWLVSGTPVNTTLMDLKNQLLFLGIDHVPTIMRVFQTGICSRIEDPSRSKEQGGYNPKIGHFAFLMRSIMMRHSQAQKYVGTNTTLMSLPPKTEETVHLNFTDQEREEYSKLETEAQKFYSQYRLKKRRSFTALSQKLLPMRFACSGGHIPLGPEEDDKANKGKGDGDAGKKGDGDGTTEDNDGDGDSEKDGGDGKGNDNGAPENNDDGDGDDGDGSMEGNDEFDGEDDEDADDDEDGAKKKKPKAKQKKAPQRFSEFCFTTKIEKLMSELERFREEDETAKTLVFSQFASTLKYLQTELPKHGFQYRTLSGDMSMQKRAKALSDFQNDPPTTIFLLSMRAGACGINLTQANRVFLMEPCFNPALEAQAIGRVHRLGQKRPVEIVRFIMNDSVESRMVQMLEKKYGNSKKDDHDGDDDSAHDNTVAKKPSASVAIGSIHSDKATVLKEEFDLLYGVAPDFHMRAVKSERAAAYLDAVMGEISDSLSD